MAVALFAPFIGRLADRLGFRRVIVLSAWSLAVATALAATSHEPQQLIFWRFVQGLVTPGIFASTIAYIHEVWPPSHAGRATAAYMTGTILGGFTGRAVAGLVAADVSWQAAFVALAVDQPARVAVALTVWLPRGTRDAMPIARREGRPRARSCTCSATAGSSRPAASASACCSRRWRCSPTSRFISRRRLTA